MRAEDAKVIAEHLLSTLESEIQTTVGVFGAVPPDRLEYRPDPLAKTALGLIRHITLEDEWLLNSITGGEFTPLPDDSDVCAIMRPADAVACYETRLRAAIARVRALPAEALTREMDLFGMIRMPAVGFLSLMVRHSVHHRGQLSSYLRPMGGKVPSIYGPTADTAAMATA